MRPIFFIESFILAFKELTANKLRSFLSLLGISFGIFVIINIFSIVSSLQYSIDQDLKNLGEQNIFIQKYPSGGGEDYPWWEYVKRPEVKYSEMKILEKKLPLLTYRDIYFRCDRTNAKMVE